MNNLYDYIKTKLQERALRIDEFVSMCEVSKSTVYRIMKGINIPGDELQTKIINILALNDIEQVEFKRLMSMGNMDQTVMLARQEMDNLVFDRQSQLLKAAPVEVILYDGDRYVRSLGEVLRRLTEYSKRDNFACDIKIVNCLTENYINTLYQTVTACLSHSSAVTVEHLIDFSESDHYANIVTLKVILAFLQLKCYNVLYSNSNMDQTAKGLLSDVMLISCQFDDEQGTHVEQMYLSFPEEAFCECFVSRDRNLHNYFNKNYMALRKTYMNALTMLSDVESYNANLLELEAANNLYMIKPDPCYDKIPLSVYKSLETRMDIRAKRMLISSMTGDESFIPDYIVEKGITQVLEGMANREHYSKSNRRIDVYSMSGMRNFAATGRISDHIPAMPRFNKTEIKCILQNIKERDADSSDPLSIYITREPMRAKNLTILCIETNGLILLEYGLLASSQWVRNCLIKQPSLQETIMDYIKFHIPEKSALSREEARLFIDELIEIYCGAEE